MGWLFKKLFLSIHGFFHLRWQCLNFLPFTVCVCSLVCGKKVLGLDPGWGLSVWSFHVHPLVYCLSCIIPARLQRIKLSRGGCVEAERSSHVQADMISNTALLLKFINLRIKYKTMKEHGQDQDLGLKTSRGTMNTEHITSGNELCWCDKERRDTQTIYTQQGIRKARTHLENTAKQNLTDKTQEAKLNIMHLRQGVSQ